MKRFSLIAAIALTAAFASPAAAANPAPEGDLTTARVVDIKTDWAAGGETVVNLEIAGQVIEARLGDGNISVYRGQTTAARIHRNAKRQWVMVPVTVEELVAKN